MIKDGKGGANTATGLQFEKRVDIAKVFEKVEGYEVKGPDVLFEREKVAELHPKYDLYRWLKQKHGVEWKEKLSKRLLPDDAVFITDTNQLIIVEQKYQETPGSVDEKLQTCDYKRKRYQELVEDLDISVEYIYVFNDWFKQDQYEDTRQYIREVGCEYYFYEIPLAALGLPKPQP